MFGFNKIAEKGIEEVIKLSKGPHTTAASAEAVDEKRDEVRGVLHDFRRTAEKKRDKAWFIWAVTGIPNIFITLPIISLPLTLITMVAVGVTCYQFLKAREAGKCLRKLEQESDPYVKDSYRQFYDYEDKQQELARQAHVAKRQEELKAAAALKSAKAAGGFNVAATNIDLDEDITVRRIKLKPRDPAVAV